MVKYPKLKAIKIPKMKWPKRKPFKMLHIPKPKVARIKMK